ncbi:MAG: hypothetical protein KGI60_02500 [Patescibacteria group bacterium]|nr:hypothetical protein [Patescibacteria group bacterium]
MAKKQKWNRSALVRNKKPAPKEIRKVTFKKRQPQRRRPAARTPVHPVFRRTPR